MDKPVLPELYVIVKPDNTIVGKSDFADITAISRINEDYGKYFYPDCDYVMFANYQLAEIFLCKWDPLNVGAVWTPYNDGLPGMTKRWWKQPPFSSYMSVGFKIMNINAAIELVPNNTLSMMVNTLQCGHYSWDKWKKMDLKTRYTVINYVPTEVGKFEMRILQNKNNPEELSIIFHITANKEGVEVRML